MFKAKQSKPTQQKGYKMEFLSYRQRNLTKIEDKKKAQIDFRKSFWERLTQIRIERDEVLKNLSELSICLYTSGFKHEFMKENNEYKNIIYTIDDIEVDIFKKGINNFDKDSKILKESFFIKFNKFNKDKQEKLEKKLDEIVWERLTQIRIERAEVLKNLRKIYNFLVQSGFHEELIKENTEYKNLIVKLNEIQRDLDKKTALGFLKDLEILGYAVLADCGEFSIEDSMKQEPLNMGNLVSA